MHYETFQPNPDLSALIKCYWTLEVPAGDEAVRQRILPDGCIELIFILGDDIKRFTGDDDFILQPRAMVLGQITEAYFIQPLGYVNSFAVRFYPYGFAGFVSEPLQNLANKETPLEDLFGVENAKELTAKIVAAADSARRIAIIEEFLLRLMKEEKTIDGIVRSVVDTLLSTKGSTAIQAILQDSPSKRRQLERKFLKQTGLSPKQLSKVIRLQAALKLMLEDSPGSLTRIAYESEYYDQAHFNKDFREFTGTSPKGFSGDGSMALSAIFYTKD